MVFHLISKIISKSLTMDPKSQTRISPFFAEISSITAYSCIKIANVTIHFISLNMNVFSQYKIKTLRRS